MSESSAARVVGLLTFQEQSLESEGQLRSLLLDAPHALEQGLHLIDAVLDPSRSLCFDLLAIDRSRRLVLVESLARDPDALLLRAPDHCTWTVHGSP